MIHRSSIRRREVDLGPATIAIAFVVLLVSGCGGDRTETASSAEAPGPTEAAEPTLPLAEDVPDGEQGVTIPKVGVTLWFPSTAGDALVGEDAEIFFTTDPGARAKQIVVALLSGPKRAGALPALPSETSLRQVYILEDGSAWVDFSSQLRTEIGGGSSDERLAVYAVVNSVGLNVPEIVRVGFLVDGNPILTLNGHLDLRRPLPPDRSILSGPGVVGRDSGEI